MTATAQESLRAAARESIAASLLLRGARLMDQEKYVEALDVFREARSLADSPEAQEGIERALARREPIPPVAKEEPVPVPPVADPPEDAADRQAVGDMWQQAVRQRTDGTPQPPVPPPEDARIDERQAVPLPQANDGERNRAEDQWRRAIKGR